MVVTLGQQYNVGHGCTRSSDGLVSCAVPDDAKQDPVVYGAEFGVVFLPAEGLRTASIPYRRASIALAFTVRVLRESATFGRSLSSPRRYRLMRSTYCIHTGGPRLPRPLPFGS